MKLTSLLRLSFLLPLATALSAADSKAVGVNASFKGPVGLQLYSLRGIATTNAPAALKQAHDFGFVDVELAGTYKQSPETFKEMLASNGLRAVSGHWSYDQWKKEPEKVIAEAKALGVKYAGCAWIGHKPPFNEAAVRDAIAVFNKAGEIAAAAGIGFFYHCHGYEFLPYKNGTLMDELISGTDAKKVSFQMDVLWVVFPGQDPVKWLRKYPGRWSLMHLKDLRKGVVGDASGRTDLKNDVAIGTGQMNWPAILKAAQEVGVKHYFIEDESPTVLEQIPVSLRFLESVKL
jgi:sugar phosphate isomerase/epimerase